MRYSELLHGPFESVAHCVFRERFKTFHCYLLSAVMLLGHLKWQSAFKHKRLDVDISFVFTKFFEKKNRKEAALR